MKDIHGFTEEDRRKQRIGAEPKVDSELTGWKLENKMKKHDQVISRCTDPAFGHVTRTGSDWADVYWQSGINCNYTSRAKKRDLIPVAQIFKEAVDTANA